VEGASADQIRDYWNQQAEQFGSDPRATTNDIWLREIEITSVSTILDRMDANDRVLDIGCGNGFSTIRWARSHSQEFVGGDYSSAMISEALQALSSEPPTVRQRLDFRTMDVLNLPANEFNMVISDRCLINLESKADQFLAIDQIARALKPGGTYVAIENFKGAQLNFDDLRVQLDLQPIPVRWHNLLLEEDEFVEHAARRFRFIGARNISSLYYLVTRGVFSKLCSLEGKEPTYDHPIYEIAAELPIVGDFGPTKLMEFVLL